MIIYQKVLSFIEEREFPSPRCSHDRYNVLLPLFYVQTKRHFLDRPEISFGGVKGTGQLPQCSDPKLENTSVICDDAAASGDLIPRAINNSGAPHSRIEVHRSLANPLRSKSSTTPVDLFKEAARFPNDKFASTRIQGLVCIVEASS